MSNQESNQLQVVKSENTTSIFVSSDSFEHSQRVAKMLASSSLIPKEYQGNIQNTMIALELANRIGASPLLVMQNLYIVHGKPSWSSSFIIAAINSCKKFSPLRFEVSGEGDDYGCKAWAVELATNERLDGTRITMKMAKAEGWENKAGSKWKTMPDQMLRYRAAAFFGRIYAPEILMGMQTYEEVVDITPVAVEEVQAAKETERLALMIEQATTTDELEMLREEAEGMGQMELFTNKLTELQPA